MGAEKDYLSIDSLCHLYFVHDDFAESLYSHDALNGLNHLGFPFHKLV